MFTMDYFAKFKKRIVPPKVQPTSAMQLAKFHKCWDYVHNILGHEDRKAKLHVEQTEIPGKLRQMVDMLVDEEARQEENTTGVCMEYFLKNGVLQYLVNVTEKTDYPEGLRGEAIRTIASMVDLLDDRFLVHNAVHKPTIKLLRFCVLDDQQSDTYHEDLVDLMYIICSKIHGFPALLNIFFHDKQWLTTPQKSTLHDASSTTTAIDSPRTPTVDHPLPLSPSPPNAALSSSSSYHPEAENNKKPEYEFLLFTYLLRFVHREGRAGDFARTGLLFLMEMATNQLGDFILDSDFATIMAAGLGALYSQLPRKLVIKDDVSLSAQPATYLLSQDLDPRAMPSGLGVVYSNDKDFKLQLDAFLKLLDFCQDVLTRCPNQEILLRLLQSIRTFFLQNILYPSILECSDIDGSAVAVITYIDLILQILQQEDLADLVVRFLMDDENEPQSQQQQQPQTPGNGHGSSNGDVFAGIEFDPIKSSPYFTAADRFTLKDLILSRLKSSSQPTVIATLKLLKTLITKHCRYSLKLLSIYPDQTQDHSSSKISTIVLHHLREIELYFSLITAIDRSSDDIVTVGYENYLNDIESLIDTDWCYQHMMHASTNDHQHAPARPVTLTKAERRRSFKYGRRPDPIDTAAAQKKKIHDHARHRLFRHRIRPTDPLLQILLGLLSHFFAQSSALNLALTGVISALALCPYRSLEGWIAFQESDRTTPDDILILNASNITHATTSSNNNSTSTNSLTTPTSTPASSTTTTNTRADDDAAARIHGKDIYAHFNQAMSLHDDIDEDDDDDDRSVDFGIERNLSQATTVQFKSFPPFFTLLRTLTQQVDFYRSEIDGFDQMLHQRWQALLFGTIDPATLGGAGAAAAAASVGGSMPLTRTTSPPPIVSASHTPSTLFHQQQSHQQRKKRTFASSSSSVSSSATASASSPLSPQPNPSKSLSSTTTAAAMAASLSFSRMTSPPPPSHLHADAATVPSMLAAAAAASGGASSAGNDTAIDPLSPLAVHTRTTLGTRLQPLFPSNFVTEPEEPILDLDQDDEDTFAPKATNPSQARRLDKSTEISLSMLLNNVVILEEAIKELVAIMHVRRSNGIDQVCYI
ncbi:Retinoic acid induced 16-like protein-domain-containing protein [Gongronella butleri]|nr:Retinoic acid induced 16-like protein-domain-containing protein [Gongronella butleri]